MKDNLTQITVVLDRSGSMISVRQPTIDGFNEFVEGQKGLGGECKLSLIQFDSQNSWEPIFEEKPVNDVPKLTTETFVPRGGTPLHDAIGGTIVDLGEKISKLAESERPSKVVVVIMTDGFENASQEYDAPKIAKMISHQQNVYKWEFVFLGANQDAILTGQKLGIAVGSTISFAASCFDPAATVNVMRSTSANIGEYRKTGMRSSLSYSAEDRAMAMNSKDDPTKPI